MFSFTKNRFRFYAVAGVLTVLSILSPFLLPGGINLGIDMTGGIQIEYAVNSGNAKAAQDMAKNIAEEIQKNIKFSGKEVMNGVTVYGIAGTNSFVVEGGFGRPE